MSGLMSSAWYVWKPPAAAGPGWRHTLSVSRMG